MTFYVLRHGQKKEGKFYNPELRHQDPPLSEKGKVSAIELIHHFSKKEIKKIYISSYIRTKQTIEPLAAQLNLLPIVDIRLNELDNGLLDDMNEQEFEKAFPQEWKSYTARASDFRFPGGETGKEARNRIDSFLTEKWGLHKNENVLIVSHDGLIRICMIYILGIPEYRRSDFKVDLYGVTEICFQEDIKRWKLIRFNQVFQ